MYRVVVTEKAEADVKMVDDVSKDPKGSAVEHVELQGWLLSDELNPFLELPTLERRQRDRYSPKIINEMTGDVTLGYGEIESAPKASSPEEARRLGQV